MDQKILKISQMKQLLRTGPACRSPVISRDIRRLLDEDETLFRWLEAHHDSPRLATLMLLESLYWRMAHNVDSILEENYLGLLSTKLPIYFGNCDNFGRPVLYVPLKRWKIEEIPNLYNTGDFLRFVIAIFETVSAEIRTQATKGKSLDPQQQALNLTPSLCKFSVVINAEGVSAHAFLNYKVMKSFFLFSKTLEAHYPGTLLRCLFVNYDSEKNVWSKTIFRFLMRPSLWRICRSDTKNTVRFFKRHSNWMDTLRSIIPSEELPIEFGGWKKLELPKEEEIAANHYHQNKNDDDESLLVNQYDYEGFNKV